MIEDIDYLGREWGKWMRYQPNGWPSKNHITNLKKISFASGNSYAPMAVTSDSLDTLDQKSYHPTRKNIWGGELKLGAGNWQISASGTSEAVYGALRKNPSYGRINNFRFHRSKILIQRFMPKDALRFHRACKNLSEWNQIMLWAHYVLVVVSPDKLKNLREQRKLKCYEVTDQQKLDLLQTTNDIYSKWLVSSRRAIAEEITTTDLLAEIRLKKIMAQDAARRRRLDLSTGPLWSYRIFASIHKFPIRHVNAKDLLPASFSPQGLWNPRTPIDFLPADKSAKANEISNIYFRQPTGEIYSVLSSMSLKRLRRQGKLDSFLDEQRNKLSDGGMTLCHFDDWFPLRGRFYPHYNAPHWLAKRELTMLDQRARRWGRELRDESPPWFRGYK